MRVSHFCDRGKTFGLARPGLIPIFIESGDEVEVLRFSADTGELLRDALAFFKGEEKLVDVGLPGEEI